MAATEREPRTDVGRKWDEASASLCVRAIVPLFLYVIFGCGCALTRAPELRVERAAWGEVAEEARELQFEVVLRNPTAPREAVRRGEDIGGALRLLEVHYVVSLDGRRVYEGRRDARATLAAGGERTIVLPAVVKGGQELWAMGYGPWAGLDTSVERLSEPYSLFGSETRSTPCGTALRAVLFVRVGDPIHTSPQPTARYRISGHVRYLTADRLSEILADLGLPHRRARFGAEGVVVGGQ